MVVYLTTSLLALAVIFIYWVPFIAALQIILYVGAIMVLFVFIMLSPASRTFPLTANRTVILPVILLTVMLVEAFIVLNHGHQFYTIETIKTINPKAVGADLFNHYKLAIEALSTLLLVR